MSEKYILASDGKTPIEEPDVLKWGAWFANEANNRIVKQDHVGAYLISTVFLGLDHNFSGHGPPLLWESMIFGEPSWEGIQQQRYRSYKEALAGHEEMLERVTAAVKG